MTATLPLAGLPVGRYGVDLPRNITVAVMTSAGLVAVVAKLPPFWERLDRTARVLVGAAAGLAALLLLTAAVSGAPAQALVGTGSRFVGTWLTVASLALVVIVPQVVTRARGVEWFLWALAAAMAILGVYAAIQYLGSDPFTWGLGPGRSAVATLGNPNFLSATVALGVPLGGWLLVQPGYRRSAGVVVLLLSVLGIALAGSRVGWAAAAAGLVALLVCVGGSRLRVMRGYLIAALPLLSVVLGSVSVAVGGLLADRNSLARLGYWQAAVEMWRDQPVTGIGLGRFVDHYRGARSPWAATLGGTDSTTSSTHSWIFDLLAGGGLLAVGLHVTVLVAVGLLLREVWLQQEEGVKGLAAGLTAVLAAHGTQSAISVPIGTAVWVGYLLVGLSLALWLLHRTSDRRSRPRARRGSESGETIAAIAAVVALVALAVPAAAVLGAANDISRTAAVVSGDQPAAALPFAARAIERAGWWPETWFAQGQVARAVNEVEAFEASYLAAYDADERSLRAANGLAELYAAMGRHEEAAPWYARSLELDPYGTTVRFDVARWQLDTDRPQEALDTLEVLDPYLEPSMRNYPRYESLREEAQEAL